MQIIFKKLPLFVIRHRRTCSLLFLIFLSIIIIFLYMFNWMNIASEYDGEFNKVLEKSYKILVNRNSYTNTPILFWNGTWKTDMDMCKDPGTRYRMLPLKTTNGNIELYAYNNSDYISRQIAEFSCFEPKIDEIIHFFLNLDPQINFIDIGANIGHRSLIVAKLGRKVLSIEALNINVQLFCASVYLNMLEDNITIINNAIGNKHEEIRMAKHANLFGSSFVDRQEMRDTLGNLVIGTFDKTISSITIDDLLQLNVMKHFQKVFIKMDIEGYEHRVLEGAVNFFKRVHVVGIVMEWRFHKRKTSGAQIIEIMRKNNFIPCHDDVKLLKRLNFTFSASISWPHDVLWINEQNTYNYTVLP